MRWGLLPAMIGAGKPGNQRCISSSFNLRCLPSKVYQSTISWAALPVSIRSFQVFFQRLNDFTQIALRITFARHPTRNQTFGKVDSNIGHSIYASICLCLFGSGHGIAVPNFSALNDIRCVFVRKLVKLWGVLSSFGVCLSSFYLVSSCASLTTCASC